MGSEAVPLPIYLDGRISAASGIEDPAELLRWLLEEAGATRVRSVDDLAGLEPGALVDLTAAACGNPLLTLLDFVGPTIPLVLEATAKTPRWLPSQAPGPRPSPAGGPDPGGASPEEQRVLAGIVSMAREGLQTSPVVDLVFVTPEDLPVVAVLDRSAAEAATEALLQDGTYRVLGKVTAVLGPDEGINLFRRSLLAALGPNAGSEMLAQVEQAGADVELVDPLLEGPILQLVPIAVLA